MITNIFRYIVSKLKTKLGIDRILFNQGVLFTQLLTEREPKLLKSMSFSVFSQWGEDGIIQYLLTQIPDIKKEFIEFGVEDYFESNTRFLLEKENWSGFVIDSSQTNMKRLKSHDISWKYSLKTSCSFITKSNILGLLEQSGFCPETGIISIDLDGNDWYVLNEIIKKWRPALFIVEYNNIFKHNPWTISYREDFDRSQAEYNVLYGAGLNAFIHTFNQYDYRLVGTNMNNSNAFFVKNALLNSNLRNLAFDQTCFTTQFRESRSPRGLNYMPLQDVGTLIKDQLVYDVVKDEYVEFVY